jgi:hypothetical protein
MENTYLGNTLLISPYYLNSGHFKQGMFLLQVSKSCKKLRTNSIFSISSALRTEVT